MIQASDEDGLEESDRRRLRGGPIMKAVQR